MQPKFKRTLLALAAAAAIGLPLAAEAHRAWFLPSATVLSGKDPWVTIDAAVSNDLFYFEHNAMRLDNLVLFGPDGKAVKAENSSTGRYRSTFDVHLTQPGTYKFATVSEGLFASYKENGQPKRWRGKAEDFAKQVPANAEDLRVSQSDSRMEVFVTAGKPSDIVLKPTGKGLELAAITHPNDLFVGEKANFGLLLDGKPAADVTVTVIPGGIRYRDKLGEIKLTTDKDGKFSVSWPEPGMYWMQATLRDEKNVTAPAKERRASYVATFEVLPQ